MYQPPYLRACSCRLPLAKIASLIMVNAIDAHAISQVGHAEGE